MRLTLEDLKAIKQASAPHLSWAIEVAYALGVRPGASELLALKWTDVDWQHSQVQVYGRKTNQLRIVPVREAFLGKLREMKAKAQTGFVVEYQGRPVKKIARAFKAACKRAGINYDVTAYSIRHLFATNALSNGADLAAVSKLLGHASIQMTANTYYHLLEKEKRRAISLLPPLD